MLYAFIENNLIIRTGSKPRWFTDGGERLTDAELIEHGVYPLIDVVPEYNPVTHRIIKKEQSEWVIGSTNVTTTYDIVANSPEQIQNTFSSAIQRLLDRKAQERGYDSGTTISTYVNSTLPNWAAEASAFVVWRDAVWAYAYQELHKVSLGQRGIPTVEDLLDELPSFEWPAPVE